MGGAALQLALYGTADVLLTGAPQVTFFKLVYRRHSLFATEAIQQAFQGSPDFGRRVTCPITRTGDLVTEVWLQITLPNLNEFRHDEERLPTATKPGIFSARWTSSSTATVTFDPPTTPDQLTDTYTATFTANDDSTVTATCLANQTTIYATGLDSSKTYTVTMVRDGDNDPSVAVPVVAIKWCNSVGHAIMKYCELEIGGARIDRHESEYLDILAELSMPEEKLQGFQTMVGKYTNYDLYDNSFATSRTLYVPLQFFFNRTPSLALPIVSMAYHNSHLNFEFRDYPELIRSDVQISSLINRRGATPSMDCALYATFVFLDVEERRRFTSSQMEMLIDQVQFLGDAPVIVDPLEPNTNKKIELNFSHPVKELVWTYQYGPNYNSGISAANFPVQGNDYYNYDLPSPIQTEEPFVDAKLQINGHDRMTVRPAAYWRLVQPYAHHTRIPTKKVYTYAFALHPEDTSPSGTCNFSRVDTAHLVLNLNPNMIDHAQRGRIRVYATNFQVLRVSNGMAALVFV